MIPQPIVENLLSALTRHHLYINTSKESPTTCKKFHYSFQLQLWRQNIKASVLTVIMNIVQCTSNCVGFWFLQGLVLIKRAPSLPISIGYIRRKNTGTIFGVADFTTVWRDPSHVRHSWNRTASNSTDTSINELTVPVFMILFCLLEQSKLF